MASNDFDETLAEAHAALDEILKGSADGYKRLYSRTEDITLGNPFGGFGHGWDGVVDQLERAASQFRDGEAAETEIIVQSISDDLAYTVAIERGRAKVGGQPEPGDLAVRVTCIYRRGADGWKLVHRHADPAVSRQPAEAVLRR